MNPLAVDHEHRSAIDKHWKEGVDYFRMETPVVCHDGESIQVSLNINATVTDNMVGQLQEIIFSF